MNRTVRGHGLFGMDRIPARALSHSHARIGSLGGPDETIDRRWHAPP